MSQTRKHNISLLRPISVFPALLVLPVFATDYSYTTGISNHTGQGANSWDNDVSAIQHNGTNHLQQGDTLNIQSSDGTILVFNSNTATVENNGNSMGPSGASVSIEGDTDWDNLANVNISNVIFRNNNYSVTVPADDKNGALGGAVGINTARTTLTNVTFDSNTASSNYQVQGGAFSQDGGYLKAENLTVTNNWVDSNTWTTHAAGVALYGVDATITNSSFTNNIATNNSWVLGGALKVGTTGWEGDGNPTVVLDNVSFSKNEVHGTDGAWVYGGATHFGGENLTVEITNSTFSQNKAISPDGYSLGGAIVTNASLLNISNSNFNGNESIGGGGAIAFVLYMDTDYTKQINIKNTVFSGNKGLGEYGEGGALFLYTSDGEGITTIESSTFTENNADVVGGAISNNETLILQGENTFSGNTADGVANDIYNDGTVNIASGTTTIDGGINGEGEFTIANGATLNMGTVTIQQGTLTLNGIINGTLTDTDNFAKFNVSEFIGDGTLNLTLNAVGEYTVFQNATFNQDNISVSDLGLYAWEWNGTYDTITVSVKSAEDIAAANDLSTTTAAGIEALLNSSDPDAQAVTAIVQDALANGDTDYVETEGSKIAPMEKPLAHSVATTVQSQAINLAGERMSIANPIGRSGGDIKADLGVWAHGLVNKTRYSGIFHGDTFGFAVGADIALNKSYVLGIGYTYNNSDIKSDNHGKTDIDTHTLFLYGQYKPAAWFINATLNWGMSQYDEKIRQYELLEIGGNYDIQSYGGQITTGYDLAWGLTPTLGVRYLHISQDDFDRATYDMRINGTNSDFLTGIAGLKYKFLVETVSALKFFPEAHAAIKYDFISDDMESTVILPGNISYAINGERLKRLGGEFGLGLTAEYNGLQMSVLYDIEIREDYTSQTGMIRLRYEF